MALKTLNLGNLELANIASALMDNILKPILLGRGVKTPMAIIFIGAIGGLLSYGVIGLFIGAVILALGYELFLLWLNTKSSTDECECEGVAMLLT